MLAANLDRRPFLVFLFSTRQFLGEMHSISVRITQILNLLRMEI